MYRLAFDISLQHRDNCARRVQHLQVGNIFVGDRSVTSGEPQRQLPVRTEMPIDECLKR